MEERIYVGNSYGRFTDRATNRIIDFCNISVLEPYKGEQSADYHFEGMKAVKYNCASPDLFKDIPVNSKIRIYFDSNKTVTFIQPV